jgi:hypothetical protein
MTADLERLSIQLRELLDRAQITEALFTYCRAVDRVDRELGYSIWNDGAEVDYGAAIFLGTARGVIDHICDSHLQGIAHSHQIANVIIKLDGDRAFSEAYVNSAMRMMRGEELVQINTRGRYLDRWSRRNGRWGIDRRVFVADLNEARTVEAGPVPPSLRLDRSDPSYAHFAGDL